MSWLHRALSAGFHYLWSGWGAIASLLLFIALWEWGALHYGDLALPSPLRVFQQLMQLLSQHDGWVELGISARRAMLGFGLAVLSGSSLGMLAGLSVTAAMVSRPLVTLLLGMPPIAWLVLAMLWFGMGDTTPVFTVWVACFPVVFAAAMQGTRNLDRDLRDMAHAYQLPPRLMFWEIYVPQVLSYVFPAWITALGSSWKVVVMAELLSAPDGVGAALAVSRSHLDMASTLAWVLAILLLLLLVEYVFLEPIKRHVERWRKSA